MHCFFKVLELVNLLINSLTFQTENTKTLKVLTIIKFSISISLHFRTQQVFPRYLAKFQSVMKIRTHGF